MDLGPDHHLQVVLVELDHPDGAVRLQYLVIDPAHVLHRHPQAGDAVIERQNVAGAAQRIEDHLAVVAAVACLLACGLSRLAGLDFTAGGFQVEAHDGEAEHAVVDGKPDSSSDRHQIPLGGGTLQHAEHQKIDEVAVGVTDGDAKQPHGHKAQTRQDGVNDIEHGRHEQEQKLQRLCDAADDAGHHAGDQQRLDLAAILRAGAVIHGERRPRQAAEEGRHLALGEERGGRHRELGGVGAGELGVEDVERAAHLVAAHQLGAARLGEANERHQDVVQTERQQQTLAGTEQEGAEGTGVGDERPYAVDAGGEPGPDQRHHQTDHPQHDGGDDGHEAGAAEEGERIGHLVGVEAGVQFGDDHPDDDGPQNAGVDGADAEDGFHPVGLLRRRVTDDVGHGQVEVDGEVEGRIADETGKGRYPLLFARQPERNGHREHHRQVDKGHQPHLGHPEEQQLQHGIVEEGHALLDRIAGERAADTEQNA